MSESQECPFCGSRSTCPTQIVAEGDASGALLRFPEIGKFPWWKYANLGNKDALRDVGIEAPTACLACGMLWAKYELARTLELVERHGSPEMATLLSPPK